MYSSTQAADFRRTGSRFTRVPQARATRDGAVKGPARRETAVNRRDRARADSYQPGFADRFEHALFALTLVAIGYLETLALLV